MTLMITFILLIIICITLRSKGLWDKKVKDIYQFIEPDVEVSEVRVGSVVKTIIYGIAIIMFPVIGISFVVIFEVLPWAFRSKKAE